MDLPPTFADTRASLHAVAEHVLAAARYHAAGRIGLGATPGGFGTPAFDGMVLRVEGVELLVEQGIAVRRAPLTTLRAAAAFVGVEPGMPDTVYAASTPLDLDRALAVDPPSSAALARWYAMADDALRVFAAEVSADLAATGVADPADAAPSPITMWPEHFDLALSAAKVNYGVSPGDDNIGEPYAYVGPWERPLPGDPAFWNQPFGAALGHDRIGTSADLVAFYRAGRVAAERR